MGGERGGSWRGRGRGCSEEIWRGVRSDRQHKFMALNRRMAASEIELNVALLDRLIH